MKTGMEVVRLLLLVAAIDKEVSVKKLIVSLLLKMIISKERNSSASQRFHAYVWCTQS